MGKLKVRIVLAGSCLLASSVIALLFYAIASTATYYSATDLYLGLIWTFVLSMIISSPVLIPRLRKIVTRVEAGEWD